MKNKIIKILVFAVMIAIINIGNFTISNAASTTITASGGTVNSGEEITVNINSSVSLGGYTIRLTDAGGCTFKGMSAPSTVTSNKNGTTIGGALSEGGTHNLATYKFTAPNVTEDKTYTIRFSAEGLVDENMDELTNTTATATITVKAPVVTQPEQPTNPGTTTPTTPTETKSTNANLKTLGINPKEYDFNNFKQNRTSYTATVPNNIEEVEVWYELVNSKATAKVTAGSGLKVNGNKISGLKEGKNTITITVTAESGATKKYTIAVTRKTANEQTETPTENPTETPEEPEDLEQTIPEENNESTELGEGIKTLSIAGITLTPEFSTDIYDYDAVLKENKDTLEIEVETTSEDYRVVIAGNEELKDGENIITLIVYDAQNVVVATYQVTVMKNTVDQNEINSIFGQIKKEEMIKTIAIIAVIALIVILLIIYIVMKTKMKKTGNKEDKKEKRNKEDIDEEFFRNFIDDKEKNDLLKDETIKNSILVEDKEENEKTEESTTSIRGRRSKIEKEEETSVEDKNKTEKESSTGTKSRIKKEESSIETEYKDFENNFRIEEIEDISNTRQTEKRKGKHF